MARTNNLTNFLTDVAAAIKTKKGSQTVIPAADFDTEILALPSQGTYQTKSVTISANTTTTVRPDQNYDAIEELTIVTQVPQKQLQTKSYNFTANQSGIQLLPDTGYDGFDSVVLNINVPSQQINNQNKTVTQNGQYTADAGYTGLGTVTVEVEPNLQNKDLTVTSNQTIDVFADQGYDGIDHARVTIRVEGGGGDDPAVNAVLWSILGYDQAVFNLLKMVIPEPEAVFVGIGGTDEELFDELSEILEGGSE